MKNYVETLLNPYDKLFWTQMKTAIFKFLTRHTSMIDPYEKTQTENSFEPIWK